MKPEKSYKNAQKLLKKKKKVVARLKSIDSELAKNFKTLKKHLDSEMRKAEKVD